MVDFYVAYFLLPDSTGSYIRVGWPQESGLDLYSSMSSGTITSISSGGSLLITCGDLSEDNTIYYSGTSTISYTGDFYDSLMTLSETLDISGNPVFVPNSPSGFSDISGYIFGLKQLAVNYYRIALPESGLI